MPLDRTQRFVMNAITREGIAEALNDTIDGYELDVPRFTPNDDRLTDVICTEYAKGIGDIGEEDLDGEAEVCEDILEQLGLYNPEEDG